jgi:putative thiamine transport system permease protein
MARALRHVSARPFDAHRFDVWRIAGAALPVVVAAPVVAGIVGVMAPAFGFHPGLGARGASLQPFAELFADPSFARAVLTSVISGLGAAVLATVAAFGFCAAAHEAAWFRRLRALLAAGLALPHASFAVGMAFLIAPSGFIARLLSPELTGWREPPDLLIVGDPWAIALLAALALKESLFLVLMIVAALGQLPADALLRTARSYGYGPIRAWTLVIAPLVYRQVRAPIYAVIAASLGSVDLALVLGPSAPPTLAPLLLRWFTDFDPGLQLRAAAGALVLLGLTLATIVAWRAGEFLVGRGMRLIAESGRRRGAWDQGLAGLGAGLVATSLASSVLATILLALWSFAGAWRWPDALPHAWSLTPWRMTWPTIVRLTGDTLAIALLSTGLALALTLAALETRARREARASVVALAAPLILPQAGFLFGIQVLWSALRWDGALAAIVWTHLLFVAPYVYLALRDPFAALDPRFERTARSLGKSRLETLVLVKIPLLLRPVLVASAIGIAVSVSLYLPTIIAGAGRISTLATETIALSAGGDRRTLGVVAITLAAFPFAALAAALGASAWAARRRRGLAA